MQRQTITGCGLDNGQLVTMVCSLVSDSLFQWLLMMQRAFKYLIPVLITVLPVSTQGKIESPFKTHPANIWISLVAAFIYFFASQHTAQLDNIICIERSIIVAAISGSLSAVSLVSMFLPDSLGYLLFIPWSFLPTIVFYQIHHLLIHHACHRIQLIVMNVVSKFSGVWSSFDIFNGNISSVQPRLPV